MSQNLMAANSAMPQVLVDQALGAVETNLYPVESSKGVQFDSVTVTNTSSSTVTVSMSVVRTGGSAGTTNRVLIDYPLVAKDTIELIQTPRGLSLGAGDKLSGIASTGSVVAVVATGILYS